MIAAPECTHSIHTPTGCVWNRKGLSHGLKTVHRTAFTAAVLPPPFRVPAFLLGKTVRQKGLVTLRCCRRRAGGKQQSTGLLHLNFRVPLIWNTKTVYPGWDTPETRCFHSIHTPTGRVWNRKGLSHGLKTCHWHVFLTPFRVPPFLLGVAVRQKGLVTLRSIRRKRRMATVHWTVAFYCSSPFYLEYKNGVSPKGYTVFGTPEGTRTPNPRNRNPMLYPLSHWRISGSPIIIAGFPGFVKRKWKKFLLPADSFCANGCFSQ